METMVLQTDGTLGAPPQQPTMGPLVLDEPAAARAREVTAIASQMHETPLPADLGQARSAWRTEQVRHLVGFRTTDDSNLTESVAQFAPEFQRVTAPFKERREALRGELRNGELTDEGYRLRVAALRTAMAQVAADSVSGPIERRLLAARQNYEGWTRIPAPTEKERAAATAVSAELQLLTPGRGRARVAEIYRDALKAFDFGVVRALVPHLQSLVERKDSAWYGDAATLELVKEMDGTARGGWKVAVGTARVAQIDHLLWQLRQITQEAIEADGDLTKTPSYQFQDDRGRKLNDFANGKLLQTDKVWLDPSLGG